MTRRPVIAAVLGLAIAFAWAGGQQPDHSGLWGVVDYSRASLSLDAASRSEKAALGFRFGARLAPPGGSLSWLRLGGELAYGATDLTGMDTTREAFAFSHLDLGLIATIHPPGYPRFYILRRWGNRTAERFVPLVPNSRPELWNYAGGGDSWGGGVEVPVTPHGYGMDIGMQDMSGRFTHIERLKQQRTSDLPYRAWMLYVGWGGPFTIDLPWR